MHVETDPNPERMPPRRCGAVVSDLHLFTNRTTVHEHMPEIRDAAESCDLFVFNGDIFDFQWSLHQGFEASVRAAEDWIRELAQPHPETRFVFLLGNHDSVPAYRRALDELQTELPHLEWRPDWFEFDGRLFLHGDVYHGGTTAARLRAYRDRCNRRLRRCRMQHALYWFAAQAGLPAFLLRFVRKEDCARRIAAYLENERDAALDGIREIYFGHVHTAFADFRHRGILFHNTGAALKGSRLSVIRFRL